MVRIKLTPEEARRRKAESTKRSQLKNKEKRYQYTKEWYQRNKQLLQVKNREYCKKYYLAHRKEILENVKLWVSKNKDHVREYKRRHGKIYGKKWREKNIDWVREYKRRNRRSSSHFSLEMQLAMNNVRKRDNNQCQWYGCGLKARDVPIHVHHIFPKSEYPELQLIEKYMICYCANHHGLWHRYRGDSSAWILSAYKKAEKDLTIDFKSKYNEPHCTDDLPEPVPDINPDS